MFASAAIARMVARSNPDLGEPLPGRGQDHGLGLL